MEGTGSSRLVKELKEISLDKTAALTVELIDGNLSHLRGTIKGACTATPVA